MFHSELSKLSSSGNSYTLSDSAYFPTFKSLYIHIQNQLYPKLSSLKQNLLSHFKDFLIIPLDTHYPSSIFYKEMISIFIISPDNFKLLKSTYQQQKYSTHLHVIVFDEDSLHQNRYFNWKATKLVTTQQHTITNFIIQLYDYCYCQFLIPSGSMKYTIHRQKQTTIFYPSNYELIAKMLSKKDYVEYNVTFYPYKRGSQELLKEQIKKIKSQERKSEMVLKSAKEEKERNRVIVLASKESMEVLVNQKEYELVVLQKSKSQEKFVRQFNQVYNPKVAEIEIVISYTLYIIIPYFDQELKEYIVSKNLGSTLNASTSIKLMEYSSLTSLKEEILKIDPANIGLVFCNSSFDMISVFLQPYPFLKLIVYNIQQKVKIHRVYQKLMTKEDTYSFIDKVVENRIQYRDPTIGLVGCYVYILINSMQYGLRKQIYETITNRKNVELMVFEDDRHLETLVEQSKISRNVRILVITRRESLKEYLRILGEDSYNRLLVLTPGHVEYNPLILDVFRRTSELIRFLVSIIIKVTSLSSVQDKGNPKSRGDDRFSVQIGIDKDRIKQLANLSELTKGRDKMYSRISEMDSILSQIDEIKKQENISIEPASKMKSNVMVSNIFQMTINSTLNQTQPLRRQLSRKEENGSEILPIDSINNNISSQSKNIIYKKSQFVDTSIHNPSLPPFCTQSSLNNRSKYMNTTMTNNDSTRLSNVGDSMDIYDHIHIYFQKNLPMDIMQLILSRCQSSNKLIPHQLSNILELVRNAKTYKNQLFISILKNQEVYYQIKKVLTSNHRVFSINTQTDVFEFKYLIYELSESKSSTAKDIENKLSKIQCSRMIGIINPQQIIDPLVFSNIESVYSLGQIHRNERRYFSEEELQIKVQTVLNTHQTLKVLVPSCLYNEFQAVIIHLQRFQFKVYSNQSELLEMIKSSGYCLALINQQLRIPFNYGENVVVCVSPFTLHTTTCEFQCLYQISSIIKLILLFNNQNNRPSKQSIRV